MGLETGESDFLLKQEIAVVQRSAISSLVFYLINGRFGGTRIGALVRVDAKGKWCPDRPVPCDCPRPL